MCSATVLPDPDVLVIEKIVSATNLITIVARACLPQSRCPRCNQMAHRVQSRYQRTVKDLPWQGTAVRLHLTVRRFYCDHQPCPQRIFTERLPKVVRHYSRSTARLDELIRRFGFVVGGNPGARLTKELQIPVSLQTILRRVRGTAQRNPTTPKILGVDDFAFRRGKTYGTILVDHEQRKVIDLLPDRTAETFAKWLVERPGVDLITRDRAHAYANGASQGAPKALQIADRFHLLKNLKDLLARVLERKHSILRQATARVRGRQVGDWVSSEETGLKPVSSVMPTGKTLIEQERRQKRLERFHQVRDWFHQGVSVKRIAGQLGMHRRDVRRWIQADEFPERATPSRRAGLLDAFIPDLQRRWDEGCHTASVLFREIRKQGFTGSQSHVRHVIGRWKASLPPELRSHSKMNFKLAQALFTQPSVSKTVWLLIDQAMERTDQDETYLGEIQSLCPMIKNSVEQVRELMRMIKERQPQLLEPWLDQATGVRFRNFKTSRQESDRIVTR